MKAIIQPVNIAQHFVFNMMVVNEQEGLFLSPPINTASVLEIRGDESMLIILFRDYSSLALIRRGRYVKPVIQETQIQPFYIPN